MKKSFREVYIGDVSMRNPLLMAPVFTGYATPEGLVTTKFTEFYELRARHVGALTPEPFCIEENTREIACQAGLYNADMIAPLIMFNTAVHQVGARTVAHLSHPGRLANPNLSEGPALSSSSRPCPGPYGKPRAMTKRDIQRTKRRFVEAAEISERAGFDLIELEFGHGHLIAQFLSPLVNDRDDGYGGNLEKRARFGLEILEALRQEVTLPVMVRLCGDEMVPGGLGLEEAVRLSVMIEAAGAAALHVSLGSGCETPDWCYGHESVQMERSWEAAERLKKAVKLPVVAAGGVRSPEVAKKLLFSGRADLLAVGKALIADPDFAGRILGKVRGRYRPCLGCLEGCLNEVLKGGSLECVSNPQVGLNHREGTLPKSKAPKEVAVVGGGPMAMEAAITLHQRGHKVTLFSPENAYIMTDDGKEEPMLVRDLLEFLKAETKRIVRVVPGDVALQDLPGIFEAVVLATGDEFESQAGKLSAESKSRAEVLSGLTRSLHKAVTAGYEAALKI